MTKEYSTSIDHGEWMQNFITDKKLSHPKSFAGFPDKLNDFQRTVFNIIGIVYDGIPNSPVSFTHLYRKYKYDWNVGGGGGLLLPVDECSLSTFDSDKLTALVFLCHEARIRFSIESLNNCIRLVFTPRKKSDKHTEHHPNLEEAVRSFRKWFKANHQINYKEEIPSEYGEEAV